MQNSNWLKNLNLNVHAPGTRFALIILALTQIPVALKTSAEIYCMEKAGSKAGSFVAGVKECNG